MNSSRSKNKVYCELESVQYARVFHYGLLNNITAYRIKCRSIDMITTGELQWSISNTDTLESHFLLVIQTFSF